MSPPPTNPSNKKLTDFFKPLPKPNLAPANPAPMAPPSSTQASSSALAQLEESGASFAISSSLPGSQTSVKPRVIPSSDGEESSNDSDLEDPFEMLRARGAVRRPPPPPSKRSLDNDLIESISVPLKPEPVKYRYSLDRLLADTNKDTALEESMKRAQDIIETGQNKERKRATGRAIFTEATAQEIMGKDGSGTRLLRAIDRTDAWHVEGVFRFFDHRMRAANQNERPFPASAMEYHILGEIVEDTPARRYMFLSGFFRDMTDLVDILPDEVLLWLLDEVCLEQREDLAYAYFQTLRKQLLGNRNILTIPKISSLLELLGAKKDMLDLDRQLQFDSPSKPSKKSSGQVSGIQKWWFWNVQLLVQLLEVSTDVRSEESTRFTCGILVRMALDEEISKESSVLASIENALCGILCGIPKDEWEKQAKAIACSIMSTILQSHFRHRVLGILPISTPRLHLFRRRLACSFLFEDGSYMTRDYEQLVQLNRFTNLLRQSQFKIQRDTNYAALQSLICILDIAVDSGATAGSTAEKDREVDQLIDLLRVMFSKIVDTNARDMARTEAKDTIERMQFRMTFAVRSKQKMALDLDFGREGKIQSVLPSSWISNLSAGAVS